MNRIFYLSSVKVNPRVNLQLLMNRVNDGLHILITDSINAWGWSNHEKTAIDGNNGWYGNKSDHLPVNKVGGAVHRVDDPRRFVGKNTRLAFSDRLLADETVEKRKRWKQLSKNKMTGCRFFRLTVKGRTSVCLLRTPVSVNRWWSSPHVHQSWSPGPRYSFWSWLWSHSLQLFLFPTQEKGFHWWSQTTVLAFFHQQEELHVLLEYLGFFKVQLTRRTNLSSLSGHFFSEVVLPLPLIGHFW